MEITGILIKILPETRGESQRGPWVRGGFVIQTDGEYPRQVAFTTFGEDRLAMVQSIALNSPVVVTFTPESREYQDRWYTDLRCSRIQNYVPGQMPPQAPAYGWPAGGAQPAAAPQAPAAPAAPVQPAAAPQQEAPAFASPLKPDEDLPF
jgi:hypothetical protein